jgi:hypothetical protein
MCMEAAILAYRNVRVCHFCCGRPAESIARWQKLTVCLLLVFSLQGYSPMPCNAFNAEKPIMGNVLYMFYLSKILDFFDTIFIILGKKWKQLSFLHVYHHLTIFSVSFS